VQVAPEDCTGCEICVEVCPAKNKAAGVKALYMAPQRPLRDAERENYAFFLVAARARSRGDSKHNTVKGSQFLTAAVRVLGRLLGLRRDAVPEARDAALRRPDARGQRDRLLVDLRRQPADDAVDVQRRGARAGLGQLAVRGQRGVRLRDAASRSTSTRITPAACCASSKAIAGDDLVHGILDAVQNDEADIFEQRARVELLKRRLRIWLDATREPAAPQCRACFGCSTSPTTS
jgi:pyruvate-ferredoxin/flavodoxin oxidoreductase